MTQNDRHEQKRASMAANLERQTGHSLQEWVEVVDASHVDGFMNIVNWLKESHGLGHFQARLVAESHRDRPS